MQATNQLHPLISNAALPPALLKPLRFGDPDQIRALYQLDTIIEEMVAEADQGVPVERLKRYRVRASIEAEETIEVLAGSREAAVARAKEKFSDDWWASDADFNFSYYAVEVKK
jgi:hypothetical protein